MSTPSEETMKSTRALQAIVAIARFTAAMSLMTSIGAKAGTLELGDEATLDYKLTLNYGVAIRVSPQSQALINGPIDPFQLDLSQLQNGTAFTHTGLPTTVNADDADRNFKQWSLINNRFNGLGELAFSWHNFGVNVSGNAFYDFVYHQKNDNDSPDTVNKTGPNNEFTEGTRYYDGQRMRLLDAYAYGRFDLTDDMHADLRIGKHLNAWGESLFFAGVASSQTPADATKAFVPGAEVKDILLPVNQISGSLTLGDRATLQSYYRLDYKSTEIFANGDYLSPSDSVGPGASFSYGAINPLYLNGCPGLITSLIGNLPNGQQILDVLAARGIDPNQLCYQDNPLGSRIREFFGAAPYLVVPRLEDIRPSKFGQWGVGLRYQVTDATNLGFYWLRYHDPNPSVAFNIGYLAFTTQPVVLTTQLINEPVPVSYNVKYYDGIDMAAISYSTLLGPFNIAGEFSFRKGLPIAVQGAFLGTVNPLFTRGQLSQALLSSLYTTNPGTLFDSVTSVTEIGYIHVNGVDAAPSVPGLAAIGDGEQLFYSKNSWGLQTLFIPTKNNVISGWDISFPINFAWLVKGNPSMPGAFGPLAGEGDLRLSVGAGVQYFQNLQIGLAYNMFFGDPEKNIGQSFLKQNPYTDRDYASLNIKYAF